MKSWTQTDGNLSLTSMPLVDEKCRRTNSTSAGASSTGSTVNSDAEQGEQVG